ncbi:extracellular solute-binding protein [Rhodovulum adriaticum]|uniref:Spermidine/putrescine transport system substrate-binding protein n=1 Tax=Rhodovulum adriaticum TaxID=35804 RepID=A0A4R2NLI8_RHOAD|nr:extracellular solute-binding protein [Rhodovulum adriaticum]MBK1635756.1 spermidine/putrescine ABC transporter substrate-binding protein [Rhodovulum adriaticum]TCP22493.1 spermidine/putrescine transport system substrate-binding protein [Rhodovulum adriaticum]
MKFTRRSVLNLTAAAVAAPAVLRAHDALASSGSVKVYAWQDYIQPNIAEKFEAETGIKLELTTYGSNDEAQSTVRASGGTDFDIVFPSIDTAVNYLDENGDSYFAPIPETVNVENIFASFLRDSVALGATHQGNQILLPFDWGTEGITLNRGKLPIADADISFGDLFLQEAATGAAAFRQKSVIMGAGLYLDATGEVPSNRMLDVYKSEDEARRVWGAITQWILAHKENFGAFWNNATEATAAFKDAGCVIGQTWDTTGLLLNRENPDFVYRAPKEGIITWMDTMGMLRGAPNPEQAVAFMNFMLTPEIGGMFANNTGYNSAVIGAADFASEEFKRQFNEVYTDDVLGNMWWWQASTPFFDPIRNEYVEIITNA